VEPAVGAAWLAWNFIMKEYKELKNDEVNYERKM